MKLGAGALVFALAATARAGLAGGPDAPPPEAALAPPPRAEGDAVATGPIIERVDFEGVRDADLGAMRDLLHLHDAGAKPDDDDAKDQLVSPGLPLDRDDLAKALRALHHSGRFSSVRAWAEDVAPGRVALKFVVTPRFLISAIAFEGVHAVDEAALTAAANLPLGTEYLRSRALVAADAIARAYFRAGYRRASVSTRPETVDGAVVLHVAIVEGAPTRLASIGSPPPTGLGAEVMRTALAMRPGDVLDLDRLAEGVKHLLALYRKERYLRAEIAEPQIELIDGLRARVVVPVEPGPRLKFVFRGNRHFTDELLAKKIGYDGEEALDDAAKGDLASRLTSFYESMGFLSSKIEVREVPAKQPGEALVAFVISEGNQRRVIDVRFVGNTHFSSEDLLKKLDEELEAEIPEDPYDSEDPAVVDALGVAGRPPKSRDGHFTVAPDSVFLARAYDKALKQIENLYKADGYLDARCVQPRLKPAGSGRIRVDIEVKEGVQTRVSGFAFNGASALGVDELTKALTVKVGDPLGYGVEQDRVAIVSAYGRKGYVYAHVEHSEEYDADRSHARIVYEIVEGPQVHVSRVELRGFNRTARLIADEAVELRAGDVLDPEKMLKSQQNLIQTALFTTATVAASDPDVPEPEKAVVVTVRENPRDEFEVSGGASLADGPRSVFTWVRQNDFGYGEQLSLAAKVDVPLLRYAGVVCPSLTGPGGCAIAIPTDFVERQIDLSYTLPHVYAVTRDLSLRADLLHVRAVLPAYALESASLLGTAAITFARRIHFQLQPGVEIDSFVPKQTIFATTNVIDLQRSRLPDGLTVLWTLAASLSLDYRDDPRNPGRGFLVQLSAEQDQSLFAQYNDGRFFGVKFVKPAALVSGYVPLGRPRWVLALSARGGVVLPEERACGDTESATDCNVTIAPKRFYLGGAQTLRGFGEEALVPQNDRAALEAGINSCRATITGASCSPEVSAVLAGTIQPSSGGEAYVLGKAELRLPLFGVVDGGLFVDVGNLWSDTGGDVLANVRSDYNAAGSFTTFAREDLRWAVGFGLRVGTPMGPMSLDFACNLNPDTVIGEQFCSPYFTIGLF